MEIIDQRSKTVGGYSYQVVVTVGKPAHPTWASMVEDPSKVYLDVWMHDEVNGITQEHQVFELTGGMRMLTY